MNGDSDEQREISDPTRDVPGTTSAAASVTGSGVEGPVLHRGQPSAEDLHSVDTGTPAVAGALDPLITVDPLITIDGPSGPLPANAITVTGTVYTGDDGEPGIHGPSLDSVVVQLVSGNSVRADYTDGGKGNTWVPWTAILPACPA